MSIDIIDKTFPILLDGMSMDIDIFRVYNVITVKETTAHPPGR